jgi:hypothetical protein
MWSDRHQAFSLYLPNENIFALGMGVGLFRNGEQKTQNLSRVFAKI